MAIIYLHGFASTGQSPKVDMLRKHFADELVVAPDLDPDPEVVVRQVKKLVSDLYHKGEKRFLFVGTSMGGFYSWYFSALMDCAAVLVNPAIDPHVTTKQWLGKNRNMQTGAEFDWHQEYLTKLEAMREFADANYDPNLIDVVVALDDEVIDALPTVQKFEGRSRVHQLAKGGHRLSDMGKVIPHVANRYGTIREQADPLLD